MSRPNTGMMDITMIFELARSFAKDMQQAEEVIKDLVIVATSGKRPRRDKEFKIMRDSDQKVIYDEVTIDDMIQSVNLIMLYSTDKQKSRITDNTLTLLSQLAKSIRDFETRKVHFQQKEENLRELNQVRLEISQVNFQLSQINYNLINSENLEKNKEKAKIEKTKLNAQKKMLEAEVLLIKAKETYYDSNTYYLSLDQARILKEKARQIIQIIIPIITPNVLKLTKGIAGEDFQQYQALAQKSSISPQRKNLESLYDD